jgi:acyl transferase domain-containing protein
MANQSLPGTAHNENYDAKFSGDLAIAVIGLSINFPQGITSLDSMWEMLVHKTSMMTEFPQDRFNIDAFYEPNTKAVNGVRQHL